MAKGQMTSKTDVVSDDSNSRSLDSWRRIAGPAGPAGPIETLITSRTTAPPVCADSWIVLVLVLLRLLLLLLYWFHSVLLDDGSLSGKTQTALFSFSFSSPSSSCRCCCTTQHQPTSVRTVLVFPFFTRATSATRI